MLDVLSPKKGLWADDFKRIRDEYRMTQEEICKIFFVTQTLWCKYERAAAEPPLELVQRVMEYFGDAELYYGLLGLKAAGMMALGNTMITEKEAVCQKSQSA